MYATGFALALRVIASFGRNVVDAGNVTHHLMKQQIIDIAIQHWNDRFVGISALDIAEKLELSHEKTMSYLEELKAEGKGTLNENVTLYQISLEINETDKDFKPPEPKPVTTHIFFPSKDILELFFSDNLKIFVNNGEYTNRLHRGFNQIELIYFEIKVLGKYLSNKEIYELSDDVTDGVLRLNSDYITNLSDKDLDEIWFDKVRYGKRKLKNGNIAISAILKDLSGLTKKEQSCWFGFELENPKFAEDDEDFSRFVSRAFDGNWTESKDPIQDLTTEIEKLNKIFKFKLFSKSENPYLRYPVNNTYKEFVDCNSELFKLIGPDNLKIKSIKNIYLDSCKGKVENLKHKKTGRDLSTMQIMELVLNEINTGLAKTFKMNWETVKQNRIEGDHKITTPIQTKDNYIESFRRICNASKNILISIKKEFEKINGV